MATWRVDPDHSVTAFSVRHMMIAYVHGQFNKLSGSIEYDSNNPASLSMDLAIEASGIFTGIAKRDEHLKSSDFLDVEKVPSITFKSVSSEKIGFSIFRISGDLSIHGVTRTVSLEAALQGPVESPFGETSIGITGSAGVDREDFGMTWNQPMEGGIFVGKDVMITVNIEADLSDD
ncbi:MAG: YceI family protein [Nitrospirae bacterium]|nr:YceI family protein [Nitrospirota bacterium]